MELVKKMIRVLPIVAFVGILGAFAILNADTLKEQFVSADVTLENWKTVADDAESALKKNIKGRERLVELYGLSLLAFDRESVGNMEYVKDEYGHMHALAFEPPVLSEDAVSIQSILELKEAADQLNTPFVYVTFPNGWITFPVEEPNEIDLDSRLTGKILAKKQVDCIDLQTLLKTDPDAPAEEDFFCITDGHPRTRSNFWEAKVIADHLTERYGIQFPERDTVFDLNNYTVSGYDFLGGFAQNAGKYFAGTDTFEVLHPTFGTDITKYDMLSGHSVRGTFEDVETLKFEENETDEYIYWITEFGHFANPYYQYVNNNAPDDAPSILVVPESNFQSGFCYLSLACRKCTIVDPRFFDGNEYILVAALAAEEYDAILVVSPFADYEFTSIEKIPDLPTKPMITEEEYGRWIGDHGVAVSTLYDGALYSCGENDYGYGVVVRTGEKIVTIYGWAADFCVNKPLQALYMKLGDTVFQCNYGNEDTSVKDVFQNEDLLNTGVVISFPTSCLRDGEVKEISFIGVSADGQYLYEPVTYPVIYID